ncbi:MAG: hypothetical protein RIB63_16280, partial [Fulvivirga sp.]
VTSALDEMKGKLETLRANGQTPRPKRQVGAWQSNETTAYSKVNDALMVAMSRVRVPSEQELQLIDDAKKLVDEFVAKVDEFMTNEWQPFAAGYNALDLGFKKLE